VEADQWSGCGCNRGEQAFFLEIRDVLVHRGQRVQPHALLNLFVGGRVLVGLHKLGDEIVDLPLPSSDCHAQNCRRILGEVKSRMFISM